MNVISANGRFNYDDIVAITACPQGYGCSVIFKNGKSAYFEAFNELLVFEYIRNGKFNATNSVIGVLGGNTCSKSSKNGNTCAFLVGDCNGNVKFRFVQFIIGRIRRKRFPLSGNMRFYDCYIGNPSLCVRNAVNDSSNRI